MEENNRLIYECAKAGQIHLIERMERAGIDVPKSVRDDILTACKATIETYIIERNHMLKRLYPLGGN